MLKHGHPAGALALVAGSLASAPLAAECRWIVQPYVSEALLERPTFEIVYDGLERRTFYAFTVVSERLAEQISESGALAGLGDDVRPLEPYTTPLDHVVYRLDPESLPPGNLYLVAAPEPVPALDRARAWIVPERPIAVSQYVPRTRGATDQSAALPRQTDVSVVAQARGIEVEGDLSICAYEVPIR